MSKAQSHPRAVPRHRGVAETGLSQERFDRVLCPNLRTGLRMGLLNPDPDGWVTVAELRTFLEHIGLKPGSTVEQLLVSTGRWAPREKRPGAVNLTAFRDTFLDHGSSSGVLNNPAGFSEARLDRLLSFANGDGRVYRRELGRAANDFYRCPVKRRSFLGTNLQAVELAGILEVYGRTCERTGERYFTRDDIVSLWKDGRFPDTWTAPTRPFVGTVSTFSRYVVMMVSRLAAGWTRRRGHDTAHRATDGSSP